MTFVVKIVGLFLTTIFFFITIFFLFSQLNFKGNYKILLVQSGSMAPTINAGDLVIVKPSYKYKKGDIVTFLSKNKFNVTHRVFEVGETQIITKGDANKVNDQEPVNVNQILGKVFYIIPYFGHLIMFIKTIPGLIILIIIPSTIIIYQEFIQIKNSFKKILN